MKLLIIGGTKFLGRWIAEAALSRGHELTLFHRGHTNKGLFEVEEILGDRDGETDKLGGRRWDAVIDTCGYFPRVVELSADQLSETVGLYCFISSISVYESGQSGADENGTLIRFGEMPKGEEITGETYGGFKVLCEEAVNRIMGGEKSLIIRPGLIVGPHDPSDRFTYWIDRFGSREEILVPDRGAEPVQFIDVRDQAEFVVRMVEQSSSGVFNTTGPASVATLGDMWSACRDGCDGLPTEIVISDAFMKENEITEWVDFPLLLPLDGEKMDVDCSKAISCGLTLRPMSETVSATAEWHRSRGEVQLKAGMSRERELELIAKWKELSA